MSLAWVAMAIAATAGLLPSGAQPVLPDAPGQVALSAAADRSGGQPALSDQEIQVLAGREARAPDLAEFRAGGPDTTTIVAWTGLGVGTVAFILALIAL